MAHHDKVLKMYADNGLRTPEEWLTLGRDLKNDSVFRLETTHKGKTYALYSRDQTQVRPSA